MTRAGGPAPRQCHIGTARGFLGPSRLRLLSRVSVDGTGAAELVTGGSAVGQGFATAMAQICAGTIGIDYRRVRVVSGQTDRIQYGIGAHAFPCFGHDGQRDACGGAQSPGQGAGRRGLAAPGDTRRARHSRRCRRASRPARRRLDQPGGARHLASVAEGRAFADRLLVDPSAELGSGR